MDTPEPQKNAPGRRVDSGEHAAADKGTVTLNFRWSGIAKAFGAAVVIVWPMIASRVQATWTKDDASRAAAAAVEKAKDVARDAAKETAKPLDNHADELATLRVEVARIAAIVDDLNRAAAGRRRQPKKVSAASTELQAIQARATNEPAPLPAPKTLPGEPPKPPEQKP